MSLIAVAMLTLSALLHSGWNLVGKKVSPTPSFFLLANAAGCLFFSPVLFFYGSEFSLISADVWGLLFLTGACQAVYMWGLAGAYRHGPISVAYPLIRAIPILLVAAITLLLNDNKIFSGLGITGLFLVTLGCLLLPFQNIQKISIASFFNVSCLFALVSALGTVGYTLIDDRALSMLRESHNVLLSVGELGLVYIFFQSLSCTFWLAFPVLSRNSGRIELIDIAKKHLRITIVTGACMSLTYSLVLVSMALVENVSYIVAFRQISIPITILLGIYMLKEPNSLPKIAGMVMTFAGVLMVSLG